MLDLQVGQALKVKLKEPLGDPLEGEFVSADENHLILNVFAHTPAVHWVYIPQGNISRIDRLSPQPAARGSFPGPKPAVGMGLSGGS
jgi:hypothetical protein